MLESAAAHLDALMAAAAVASLRGRQIKRRIGSARLLALVQPLGMELAEIVDHADATHDLLCKVLECRQAERSVTK